MNLHRPGVHRERDRKSCHGQDSFKLTSEVEPSNKATQRRSTAKALRHRPGTDKNGNSATLQKVDCSTTSESTWALPMQPSPRYEVLLGVMGAHGDAGSRPRLGGNIVEGPVAGRDACCWGHQQLQGSISDRRANANSSMQTLNVMSTKTQPS
jgi:hypothetical protein